MVVVRNQQWCVHVGVAAIYWLSAALCISTHPLSYTMVAALGLHTEDFVG